MSLFRKAGEKFEETKRRLESKGESEYVCQACEAAVSEGHEYCPHCGEAAVELVE